MKALPCFLLLLLLVPALSFAQRTDNRTDAADIPQAPLLSSDSPFSHLSTERLNKSTAAAKAPFVCPYFLYYQNGPGAQFVYHTEDVPTSDWATKVSVQTTATVCTVWAVKLDFELLNANMTAKDTIRIFVREAFPPYTEIFSTWYLARVGTNSGYYEIDPPLVPPYQIRAIMNITNQRKDFLLGFRILGDSLHDVKFKYTTPSLYPNYPRSFKFATSTSLIPASTAVGQSVDQVFEARLCCDFPIPVELSTFSATVEHDAVRLFWRTETETNNYHFEVQRALAPDGPWESRGFVPGHGTTTIPQEYHFRDPYALTEFGPGAPPVYWYRLMQHDYDGARNDFTPIQVHVADIAASGFELSPVYPNPVSLSVHEFMAARYRIVEAGHVRISVHDLLGRELAVLTDQMHPVGVFETAWYPDRYNDALRSGQYFLRMQVGAFNAVQRFSIVR
ncbi:MAG: T9SS type A sorting domain-containing protein [Bacteroidota bacterium]|nr:T9SS type A sorting domain-containing protein [Bacteroidota bacterium]